MMILVGRPVVYRNTLTGLRISAVNGTAFIDNAGATVPTFADGNHLIEIYDASGRMLKGVLKAAGSGTFGDTGTDIIGGTDPTLRNGDFSLGDTVWNKGAGWTIADSKGKVDNPGAVSYLSQIGILTLGAVYKTQYSITDYTDGNIRLSLGTVDGPYVGSVATFNEYYTCVGNTGVYFGATSTATLNIDSVTIKQVTAPSTSGCTIVSTKGGTTYNFAYKDAAFTYNAASYYVIVKKVR